MTSVPRHARYAPVVPDAYDQARHGAHREQVGGYTLRREHAAQMSMSEPYDGSAYITSAHVVHRQPSSRADMASAALVGAAMVLRIAATMLCLLILANAAAANLLRLQVVAATAAVTSALPQGLSGILSFPTIRGGVFRGDIAIAALALFVIDWLFVRIAATMRGR